MNPFKPGDRVHLYNDGLVIDRVVVTIDKEMVFFVEENYQDSGYHYKQCRKLKKKEKKKPREWKILVSTETYEACAIYELDDPFSYNSKERDLVYVREILDE